MKIVKVGKTQETEKSNKNVRMCQNRGYGPVRHTSESHCDIKNHRKEKID